MTAITWHGPNTRTYEAGVDRGVLYVDDQSGVPWNGLIDLREGSSVAAEEIYFDAQKINDIITHGNFTGKLTALTYPDEFLVCEGVVSDQSGVYVTDQPPSRFGLCYRTMVGDVDAGDFVHYKLHVLYNLTAIPSSKDRETLSLDTEPLEFEWDLTAIPEQITGHRPTAHLILDSRELDPWLLLDIEEILYGSDTTDPQLPGMQAFTTFIRKWDRLIIVDNGDGTWSAISQDPNLFTWVDSPTNTHFSFEAENVVWLDDPTNTHFQVSSSDKNEEDL